MRQLAAQHDRSYLTAPITLVQDNKKPRKGALILLPLTKNPRETVLYKFLFIMILD